MRLLHTSDWHLGKLFFNAPLIDDQRHVLNQIVQIAIDQTVDAVLIAGDIFDRPLPAADAIRLYSETMTRLHDAQIPVILIAGNHDGPDHLGALSEVLSGQSLHITGPLRSIIQPVEINTKGKSLRIYPIPFVDPPKVREVFKTENIKNHGDAMALLLDHVRLDQQQRTACDYTLVMAHCFVVGGIECDSERPLSVGGADQINANIFDGFDYVALGHLHKAQTRSKETIQYSGSPLKYSFSEISHVKSINLIELTPNQAPMITRQPLTPRREVRCIEGIFKDILKAAANDPNKNDFLLIRLLDNTVILHPMEQLRQVYPNVMHLEQPRLIRAGERTQRTREHLQRTDMEMFTSFFKEMTDDALTDGMLEELSTVLETLSQEVS